MKTKSNDPRLTHKQICHQLGFSDSTIKRYRDDFIIWRVHVMKIDAGRKILNQIHDIPN